MTALRNLTFLYGETCEIEHVVVDDDGNPIDLSTGVAVQWFIALDPWSAPILTLSLGDGIELTTPAADGGVRVVVTPDAQEALVPRSYHHECSVKLSDGSAFAQFYGLFTFSPSVASGFTFSNSLPSNVARPVITGSAVVGGTLSATSGAWIGYPAPSFTYQWRVDGADVSGATGSTYVIQAGDLGKTITVVVTATNGLGAVEAESLPTAAVTVANAPPVNLTVPVVSGSALVGQTLSATAGTWSGVPSPSFAYQWRRDGSPISGATASTYALVAADAGAEITVIVTATNGSGNASASSAPTSEVLYLPTNTALPAISGVLAEGQNLSASTGTWAGFPTPTYAYQWKRDGVAISGATSNTYAVTADDIGPDITVTVTATNTAGSAQATSTAVSASGPPVNVSPPTISGTPEQFQTLTCSPGLWSGAPTITYAYQWKREGVAISGGAAATYVPDYLDVGFTLTCTVTATNGEGSDSATSDPTNPIDIVQVGLPSIPSMIFAFEPGDTSSNYISLDETFAPSSVDTVNDRLDLADLNFSAYNGGSGDFKGAPVFFSSTGTLPAPLQADTPYYISPNGGGGYDVYPEMSDTDHTNMPSQVYFEEPMPAQNFIELTNKINLTTQGTGTHRIYSEPLIDKIFDRLGSGCTIQNRVLNDRQSGMRVQIDGNGRHVVSREIARDPRANEGGTYNLYGPSPVQGGISTTLARQAVTNRRAGWVTHVARIIPNNNRNIRKNILAPTAVNTTTGVITYDNINGRFATGDRVKFKAPPAGNAIPAGFTAGTSYYVRLGAGGTSYTLHPTALDATNNTNPIIPTTQGAGIFVLFAPERVGDGHRQMFFLEWLEANGGANFITSFPKYSGPTNRGIVVAANWTLSDDGSSPENGDILGQKPFRDLTRIEIWFAPEATRPVRLDTGLPLADGFYYVTGYVGGSSYGRLHDTLEKAEACVGIATNACSSSDLIKFDSGTAVVGEALFTYGGGEVPWALNSQWSSGPTPQTSGEDETFTTDRIPYGVAGDPVHTFTFLFDNNNPDKATPIAKLYLDGVLQGEYALDGTKGQSSSTAATGVPAWTWLNSAALHVPFTGDIYATYMGATTSEEVTDAEILDLHEYTFAKFAVVQGPPVPLAPSNTSLPVISGTLTTGQTLNVSDGAWSEYPAGTKTYQWKRDGSNIAGATSSTYLLIAADADTMISCDVTSTNASGSDTATADAVGPIVGVPTAPSVAVAGTIDGDLNEGFVLTLTPTVWNGYPAPSVAIQWKRNGVAISGATAFTYTTVSADAGTTITCTETATNASGSDSGTSNGLGPIIAAPAYETEATTLFARMSPAPDVAQKLHSNTLIKALKDAGVWTKLDMLQVYAVPESQHALLDWKESTRTAALVVAGSGPIFTADRGYKGTLSVADYINTNYNPTTYGGQSSQNSAHIGVYPVVEATDTVSAGAADIGVTRGYIITRSGSGQHQGLMNNTTGLYGSGTGTIATAVQHFVHNRTGSTGFDIYRDGLNVATQPGTSAAPTNANIRVLMREGGSSYSTRTIGIVHAGGGLTAQNIADMEAAFTAYLVARGAL